MRLSVVIPVYNVEKTVDRCVDSVVAQDYGDMQIILVDDGSTDKSGYICDEWASRYDNIIVIHKQNGGLSDARNAGIEKADGELLTFVDSDDFIAPGTYSSVIGKMSADADVIEYVAWMFYGSKKESILSFENKEYTEKNDYWIGGQGYTHTYAWNKIYRRKVFDTVRYPVGKVFEDAYTMPLILRNIHVLQTVDAGTYYYCYNDSGITSTAGVEERRMLLLAHLNNWDVTVDDVYLMHVVNMQLDLSLLDSGKPLLGKCRIKSFNGLTRNNKIKAVLLNIIGIGGLCKLYRLCGGIMSYVR